MIGDHVNVIGYVWAGPNTLLGLTLALLALRGGRMSVVRGVFEVHGPALRWLLRHLTLVPGGAAAITFGHVVIGTDAAALELTRAHERVHVRQYERWGALFIPAYLAAGLWMMVRGRHPYLENPFEREATSAQSRLGVTGVVTDQPPHPPFGRREALEASPLVAPRAAPRRPRGDAAAHTATTS